MSNANDKLNKLIEEASMLEKAHKMKTAIKLEMVDEKEASNPLRKLTDYNDIYVLYKDDIYDLYMDKTTNSIVFACKRPFVDNDGNPQSKNFVITESDNFHKHYQQLLEQENHNKELRNSLYTPYSTRQNYTRMYVLIIASVTIFFGGIIALDYMRHSFYFGLFILIGFLILTALLFGVAEIIKLLMIQTKNSQK